MGLFSKEPKDDGQHQAEEQAGHDGEVETEIPFRVMNVSGEAAEPAFAEAGPEQRPDDGQEQADDNQEFSEIGHG
jgi:hypothetical protein